MKVSIVTISQYRRFPVLKLLVKHLLAQTVQPTEWVIVEGSKNPFDAVIHAADIATLETPFPIRYLPYQDGLKLGGLRNRGNQACTGDITICMDDDDYYPPNRIQHVLDQFRKHPQHNIAGCSNVLVYDYSLKRLYQCTGFHANHATNNTMAWRTSYVKDHQHDPEKSNAEEESFCNGFSEKMVTLDPSSTVIVSSHTINTFDKQDLLQNNPRFKLLPHTALYSVMPEEIHKKYVECFTAMKQ